MATNRPIKPEEISEKKVSLFPDEVFESFNELITQKFCESSATVTQDEVVALMVKKGLDRTDIFEKGWLNVEDIYRKEGWLVDYDKPGYNESYHAIFTFSKTSKKS